MSGGSGMTQAVDEIRALLQIYFDAWYECDVEKLKAVFHPSCHLVCVIDGELDDDDMAKVHARIAKLESGASRGDARHDKVLMVDVASPTTAAAKVRLAIGKKLFTDYLSLLRLDGRWVIMAKVFSFRPLAEGEAA